VHKVRPCALWERNELWVTDKDAGATQAGLEVAMCTYVGKSRSPLAILSVWHWRGEAQVLAPWRRALTLATQPCAASKALTKVMHFSCIPRR
jgi:hypothetical protein